MIADLASTIIQTCDVWIIGKCLECQTPYNRKVECLHALKTDCVCFNCGAEVFTVIEIDETD